MVQEENFFDEIEKLTPPDYHVLENMENITNPLLMEIDMLYRFADALSIKNANFYRTQMGFIAFMGALIALYFLYYDLSSSYVILIVVVLSLIFLYLYIGGATLRDRHGRYLQYRVLAETLRIQFFLSFAGIKKPVKEILPWLVRKDISWIEEILNNLAFDEQVEKQPILEMWIIDQRDYHKDALEKNRNKRRKQKRNQKYSLILTIGSYFLLFLLDVLVAHFFVVDMNFIRDGLKLIIGIGAAYTLYSVNYYGKLSLLNTILHHERMIKLYDKVEGEIRDNGGVESEDILLYLAEQCLIENAVWYSSLIDNKPEWVL